MASTGARRPPAVRVLALGPVLLATAVLVAALAVLWLRTLPAANPHEVCPAIYPGPWWCTAAQVQARGARITQVLLLVYAAVVAAATLLHRRWPRAAWLPVLVLPVAGWLTQVAATP
ncbi:hypothetical protein [Cellulomonas pakistanensis]|uniref:hypothetical protein n=1 Tax=Cellulomonas pakistanensis TaxID=992287 RepID=UPI001942EC27|nr:hypothetical protein [Cellulomonas pakistanensis]